VKISACTAADIGHATHWS